MMELWLLQFGSEPVNEQRCRSTFAAIICGSIAMATATRRDVPYETRLVPQTKPAHAIRHPPSGGSLVPAPEASWSFRQSVDGSWRCWVGGSPDPLPDLPRQGSGVDFLHSKSPAPTPSPTPELWPQFHGKTARSRQQQCTTNELKCFFDRVRF